MGKKIFKEWWYIVVIVFVTIVEWVGATDRNFFTRHTPVSLHHGIHGNGIQPQCEPLRIDLCKGVGYEETLMPNIMNHDTQADAEAFLQTFTPLIKYGCSSHLTLLLCSTYAPMCTDKVAQPIGPCRDVCLSVRSKCEPVLKEFGFPWPEGLDCNLFHAVNNHEHMCIPIPDFESDYAHHPHTPVVSTSSAPTLSPHGFPFMGLNTPEESLRIRNKTSAVMALPPLSKMDFGTLHGMKAIPGITMDRPVVVGNEHSCGDRKLSSRGECWTPCEASGGFTREEKKFARHYVLVWSLISLIASLVVILLATACARKLCSPAERPLLYIVCCQILYSFGTLASVMNSWDGCMMDKQSGVDVLARGSLVPPTCSLVFLLTYFFGNASVLWWLMLCLSWVLSLKKKFANRLGNRESSLFHLVAWGMASLLTCLVLLGKQIDSDSLTGICGVGYQDSRELLLMRLIPLGICVGQGLVFLLWGGSVRLVRGRGAGKGVDYQFVSSIPTFANSQQMRLKEEQRAMWARLVLFAVLHLLTLGAQLVVTFYEYLYREEEWERIRNNLDEGGGGRRRRLDLILLLHNLQLAPGLTTCVWVIWRASWKNWIFSLSELKKKLNCKKYLSDSSGHLSRRQGYNNPGTRSLPPPPEEAGGLVHGHGHGHGHHHHHHDHHVTGMGGMHEMRTDTWRRGETIV